MSRSVTWRAALIQAGSVAAIAVALALALDDGFFEDWGWLSGPLAWALSALLTARVLRLPAVGALVGAALAGLPGVAAVAIGVHWLGPLVGVLLFGLWCGRLARDEELPAHLV